MFTGKSHSELEDLNRQIKGHIENGHAADIEYWENLLKHLQIHKAKSKLREIHQDLLQKRLRKLTENGDDVMGDDGEAVAPIRNEDEDRKAMPPPQSVDAAGVRDDEDGDWSPLLMQQISDDEQELVEEEVADMNELHALRQAVLAQEASQMDGTLGEELSKTSEAEDVLFAKEAAKLKDDSEDGEIQFADEISLTGETYLWHDKYRPRKPRYFNRVHTGYEWNKYNQTHYDHDNPPPKVVQGYKFNIFYPDLIDKTKAPSFHINPDPDGNAELCVLRFHAGPPYEDLAFKVVNREWEYSHKKGFKCTFDRGILHLFFNFKRHRYRR